MSVKQQRFTGAGVMVAVRVALAFLTGTSTADLEAFLACCCVQGGERITLQATVIALNGLVRGPSNSLTPLWLRQLAAFKASVLPLLLPLPSALHPRKYATPLGCQVRAWSYCLDCFLCLGSFSML
jgi:hypothetical protein